MKDKEEIKVGIKAIPCSECPHRYAADIVRNFSWPSSPDTVIGFDGKANEITVNEKALMRLIQILNPAQKPRKIRLVSGEER